MLSRGWRRSGPNSRPRLLLRIHLRPEEFIERSGQERNLPARSVRQDRNAAERPGGRRSWPRRSSAIWSRRSSAATAGSTSAGSRSANWTSFPKARRGWPSFKNPISGVCGRRDRRHSLLGAPHSGRAVSGLRHQLRPSGMPGALVCRSRDCSCARVMAACTTRTARAPRDRRRAGCSSIQYKVEDGKLLIEAGQLPTLSTTASLRARKSGCQG